MPVAGSTNPNKIILSTAMDNKPEVELFLMGPFPSNKFLRITVYDQTLFLHGALKKHFQTAFSIFNASNPRQVVPEPLHDPENLVSDGSNGVLFFMEILAQEVVPEGAAPKDQHWSFGKGVGVKECRPAKTAVEIALTMRNKDNRSIVQGSIRVPFSNKGSRRQLIIVVEDPVSHEIHFSNGWENRTKDINAPGLHTRNHQGPLHVNTAAVDVALRYIIGGSGLSPGAPDIHRAEKPVRDMTGMYELFPNGSQRPGEDVPTLLVQLNQAGNSFAGWMAPVEDQVTTHAHLRLKLPPVPAPLKQGSFGVMLGFIDGGEFKFNWGLTEDSEDPAAFLMTPGASGEIEQLGDGIFSITFGRGADSAAFFLRLAEPTPRWSNSTARAVVDHDAKGSDRIKKMFKGRQARPIPGAFFNLLAKDFVQGGRLAKLIVADRTIPNNNTLGAGQATRGAISDYLERLLVRDEYEEVMAAYFIRITAAMQLKIDVPDKLTNISAETTKTVLEWLLDIVKDQLDILVRAPISLPSDQAFGRVDPGFKRMGLCPKGSFIYRFEFFSVGAEVGPKSVKVGAYYFDVEIKRFSVSENDIERPNTDKGWTSRGKKMHGGMGDIGIGLEFDFKEKVTKKGRAGAPITKVDFRSFHDLAPGDINTCSYYVISTAGPSLGFNQMKLFTGASSAVVVLSVNKKNFIGDIVNTIRMVGSVDKWMTGPDFSRLPNIVLKAPKSPQEEIKIKFASISMGWGWMTDDLPVPIPPPEADSPPSKKLDGRVKRSVRVFFRRNSPSLVGDSLAGLEEALAIERAVFVSGNGYVVAEGHCSPEGPDNDKLSQDRAEAAIEAVGNAFGKHLTLDPAAFGRGDKLARRSQFFKPPFLSTAQDQNKKNYPGDEGQRFADFRFIQLNVEGTLIVTIESGKGSASSL